MLPADKIEQFIRQTDKIYEVKINQATYQDLVKDPGSTKDRICMIYKVQDGDFCHKLAMKYNCTIENIKAWNKLTDDQLQPGQQLKIWIPK